MLVLVIFVAPTFRLEIMENHYLHLSNWRSFVIPFWVVEK